MNEYLFVIDKTGNRIASYLLGVHEDTYEALEEIARSEHPNDVTFLRGTEVEQQKFVNQNMVYIDGEFKEYVHVETKEEQLEALKQDYESQKQELMKAFQNALLENDEELMASIREDLDELKEAYKEGVADAQKD